MENKVSKIINEKINNELDRLELVVFDSINDNNQEDQLEILKDITKIQTKINNIREYILIK